MHFIRKITYEFKSEYFAYNSNLTKHQKGGPYQVPSNPTVFWIHRTIPLYSNILVAQPIKVNFLDQLLKVNCCINMM